MHNLVNDILRDSDDGADDLVCPDLTRERIKRLPWSTPWTTRRPSARLSSLPDKGATESGSSALRVLILEDDPAAQELFSILLAPEEGFQVEYVSEIATCLARLRATSVWSDFVSSTERLSPLPFDVLLLDVRLHGRLRGTEVFTLAEADPGLHLPPTVICTALVDRALAALLKDCRAGLLAYTVRVVLKPFDRETLATELRSAAWSRTAVLSRAYRPAAVRGALAGTTKGTQ